MIELSVSVPERGLALHIVLAKECESKTEREKERERERAHSHGSACLPSLRSERREGQRGMAESRTRFEANGGGASAWHHLDFRPCHGDRNLDRQKARRGTSASV